MTDLLLAAGAGLASGLALVAGAALAWWAAIPRTVVATVMGFGAGVLVSALAFDLVAEATRTGSFWTAMAGFLGGAVVYVGLDALLERRGARNKGGSGGSGGSGSGLGIALGALLDGIPETAVQGVGLASGGGLSVAVLAAVVISNLPEGLSSTSDMKAGGRGARYVFSLWGAMAVACSLSALAGYALLGPAPAAVRSGVTAVAAGAILAMLANTMLPEAYRRTRTWTGLVVVLGFFVSYGVHTVGAGGSL